MDNFPNIYLYFALIASQVSHFWQKSIKPDNGVFMHIIKQSMQTFGWIVGWTIEYDTLLKKLENCFKVFLKRKHNVKNMLVTSIKVQQSQSFFLTAFCEKLIIFVL